MARTKEASAKEAAAATASTTTRDPPRASSPSWLRSAEGSFSSVMVPLAGKLVLFGGQTSDSSKVFGDTWVFDGASWTHLEVAGPSARALSAMAAVDGRTDTWSWDGAKWTQLNVVGPSARFDARMAAPLQEDCPTLPPKPR